jgi:hypothetical protein
MRFTTNDAQKCADSFDKGNRDCGKCRFSNTCVFSDNDRLGLVTFFNLVNPEKKTAIERIFEVQNYV